MSSRDQQDEQPSMIVGPSPTPEQAYEMAFAEGRRVATEQIVAWLQRQCESNLAADHCYGCATGRGTCDSERWVDRIRRGEHKKQA